MRTTIIHPEVENSAYSLDTLDGTRVTVTETPMMTETLYHVQVATPPEPNLAGVTYHVGRIVKSEGRLGFLFARKHENPLSADTMEAISKLLRFVETLKGAAGKLG